MMITNRIVGTHLGASANTRNTQQFGHTKVRPYKILSFNALQRAMQKGADYIVISTLLPYNQHLFTG